MSIVTNRFAGKTEGGQIRLDPLLGRKLSVFQLVEEIEIGVESFPPIGPDGQTFDPSRAVRIQKNVKGVAVGWLFRSEPMFKKITLPGESFRHRFTGERFELGHQTIQCQTVPERENRMQMIGHDGGAEKRGIFTAENGRYDFRKPSRRVDVGQMRQAVDFTKGDEIACLRNGYASFEKVHSAPLRPYRSFVHDPKRGVMRGGWQGNSTRVGRGNSLRRGWRVGDGFSKLNPYVKRTR